MADPTPITNPTPKQRFQYSAQNISAHREMVASMPFQRALDFALLQYQLDLVRMDPAMSGAGFFRMVGAQEFIAVLRNLGEPVQHIAERPAVPNLIHKP